MAFRSIALFVFVLPVIFSVMLGSFVMAEVLQKPDRELHLLPFSFESEIISNEHLQIIGLKSEYSTSSQIEIQISLTDSEFDCGDLYVTITKQNIPKEVVSQNAFFGQCFVRNNSLLPVEDEFSETIDVPGEYEISFEMNDKHYDKVILKKETFIVK